MGGWRRDHDDDDDDHDDYDDHDGWRDWCGFGRDPDDPDHAMRRHIAIAIGVVIALFVVSVIIAIVVICCKKKNLRLVKVGEMESSFGQEVKGEEKKVVPECWTNTSVEIPEEVPAAIFNPPPYQLVNEDADPRLTLAIRSPPPAYHT